MSDSYLRKRRRAPCDAVDRQTDTYDRISRAITARLAAARANFRWAAVTRQAVMNLRIENAHDHV
jgi:hypothetical protein